jgi:hypothetical protein
MGAKRAPRLDQRPADATVSAREGVRAMTGEVPPRTGDMTDHTLVFICGLHRSGTTPLHQTLATHADVSGFRDTGAPYDEGQHLQDVYPTAGAHGGPGRFAFDPAAHLTESSPLATPEAAQRLFGQWARHWQLDRRVLIEKSPPNLIRTRLLQRMYPGARFVVIVRHPLVTALATTKFQTTKLMRLTFRRPPLFDFVRHWAVAHRIFLTDLPSLEHAHVLRWEDLCADPAGALRDIAAFIGVDDRFDVPDLDPAVDDRYLTAWDQMLAATGRRGAAHRRVAEEIYTLEPEAATFGYSLREPRVRAPLELPLSR